MLTQKVEIQFNSIKYMCVVLFTFVLPTVIHPQYYGAILLHFIITQPNSLLIQNFSNLSPFFLTFSVHPLGSGLGSSGVSWFVLRFRKYISLLLFLNACHPSGKGIIPDDIIELGAIWFALFSPLPALGDVAGEIFPSRLL